MRDGRADAALLYTPRQDATGLATEPLLEEPQVAVLPASHRLAGRAEVSMADLDGETLPRALERPGGPVVGDGGQLMQLIALGRAAAVLPASMRGLLRDDLVAIPVTDAAPTTLVLAWPEASRSRALAAFVRSTVRHLFPSDAADEAARYDPRG
ncbi:LysR substrate-binding domain-containing protein, partial [Actinomadura sp. BRA 177]|uniref:LysR substrate-binding domain-containing protein n=1 Tax=Actinomadura sp. BRA 177 TaxID=2745202 RepID=UPI0020CD89AD